MSLPDISLIRKENLWKIIEINIINSSDDKAFLNKASKGIIEKIINEQNTDVDVVSGATYSSNGIINAVKDALK